MSYQYDATPAVDDGAADRQAGAQAPGQAECQDRRAQDRRGEGRRAKAVSKPKARVEGVRGQGGRQARSRARQDAGRAARAQEREPGR